MPGPVNEKAKAVFWMLTCGFRRLIRNLRKGSQVKDVEATAKKIVDEVFRDLLDRRGVRQSLEACDEEVLAEMKATIEKVVVKILKRG